MLRDDDKHTPREYESFVTHIMRLSGENMMTPKIRNLVERAGKGNWIGVLLQTKLYPSKFIC